ncbi:MAG: SEC-C metal-binding domain-containing protein [Thermodesulfovibrionia bacterium]|nr:SEC-C metal-binding domain-containing protein [Thermodesulfovibrionia bacterium]
MNVGRNDPCPCGSGKKYKKCCLSTAYVETGREESMRAGLVQDLLRFFKRNYDDRLDDAHFIFWDEFIPEDHLNDATLRLADINFWEWIVYDYIVDEKNDKTLIDLYMENNRKLSLDEHRILTMMKNSVISLYEVQEVFPEKGLLLKDLVLGGEYDVREKAATRSLRKWDIFAARLLHVDGTFIMSGSVYTYPIKQKERILDDLKGVFEDYRKDYLSDTLDEFLKRNSDVFNFYWYDLIQNPPPLKLATTSGEPFLFSKAVFEIKDKQTIMNGLKQIEGFEQDKNGFGWFDKRDKDGSATILGNIEIKGDALTLECNSKERLERGKKLILENTPGAVIHKIDSFQDPMQALKSYEGKPEKKTENEIPMEIQQQLYAQFMQKHSEKWLKKRIPALDGKTPVQAIKTDEGRRKVIELLKSFENSEEHNKREGRPFYNLSWMWDRLGLERER